MNLYAKRNLKLLNTRHYSTDDGISQIFFFIYENVYVNENVMKI